MATLKAMFKLFDGYSTTIDKINRKTEHATDKILRASGSTDKFNNKLEKTGASSKNASNGLNKLIGSAITLATAVKGMNIADEFTNTSARLNLINDGLQTQAELQDKIFKAANRSKGVYTDMAGAISKMGLMAGESFGSNDELIGFTELIQKGFKVGGSSASEQSSAMLQLTQAMGAGKLQGDEFRSIMENAPMIADAIAKYVGVSKGELKELSSEGAITSDIIKNAMFMASDDINAKFKTMPTTFSDIWTKIKNGALKAFDKVFVSSSKLINSQGFMGAVNGLIVGITILATVAGYGMDAIAGIFNFISNNWGTISPIIMGIVASLLIYNATLLTSFWNSVKDTGAKIAQTIATWQFQAALFSATFAQQGFNAALSLCPLSWFVYGIIAIVVIFYALIGAINKLAGTSISATGIIAGVFMVALAFIGNLFVHLWNIILVGVENVWNFIATFAEILANIFVDPIGSIIRMFGGLATTVLEILGGIASAIDSLFGSNLADAVNGWQSGLDMKVAEIAGEAKITVPRADTSSMRLDRFNYGDAYDSGYNFGSNFADKFSMDSILGNIPGLGEGSEFDMSNFGTGSNPLSVEGTGKNGSIDVNMADEDLKYMRDIAEREYVNKFSSKTLAPQITVTFGDVKETADVDQVAKRITKILKEEIETTGEGIA